MSIAIKIILSIFTRLRIIFNSFIKIGSNTVIYPNARITNRYGRGAMLKIGNHSRIGCWSSGYKIGWFHPVRISLRNPKAIISIGNYCELNGVNIYCRSKIEIGDNAQIAGGTIITDTNGHEVYQNRRNRMDSPKPIIIGSNVWLGLNSIILKGTKIGDNSIVAANSVVKGTFPPNSLIIGNPAVVAKTFDKNQFS